ncbi:uncharacterized protein LOC134230245 [Saccostrea cucullata]|uniref:uncharacterized protein LOC134230245 n=1 Tax=Saccostrea cuccullata TaxID=36930 RepID=UPI002ED3CFCD
MTPDPTSCVSEVFLVFLILIQFYTTESQITKHTSNSYRNCSKVCRREKIDCANECRVDHIRNRKDFLECAVECKEDYVECDTECMCLIPCDQQRANCIQDCATREGRSKRRCYRTCFKDFHECYDECM